MQFFTASEWSDKQPKPRKPIPQAIIHCSEPVRCRGEALHQVFWQGRQWAVTSFGVECRDGRYVIEASRIWQELGRGYDWVDHMSRKCWVDLDDFRTALWVARGMHAKAEHNPIKNSKATPAGGR